MPQRVGPGWGRGSGGDLVVLRRRGPLHLPPSRSCVFALPIAVEVAPVTAQGRGARAALLPDPACDRVSCPLATWPAWCRAHAALHAGLAFQGGRVTKRAQPPGDLVRGCYGTCRHGAGARGLKPAVWVGTESTSVRGAGARWLRPSVASSPVPLPGMSRGPNRLSTCTQGLGARCALQGLPGPPSPAWQAHTSVPREPAHGPS